MLMKYIQIFYINHLCFGLIYVLKLIGITMIKLLLIQLVKLRFFIRKVCQSRLQLVRPKVVDGFGKLANYSSLKMKKLQGGVVQAYILGGLVAIILITLIVQQI